jgi:hypothetical protein
VTFFFIILLAGTIPSIKSILSKNSEIKERETEIKELDSNIAKLNDLKSRESQIDSDLAIVNKVVPSEKTQVAKFVGEIDTLAKENNLVESEYQSGEQIDKIEEKVTEQINQDSAAVVEIPTMGSYKATLDAIKAFLNKLYAKNDLIIISSMGMQGSEAREILAREQQKQGGQVTVDVSLPSTTWTITVTFAKYQFSRGFNSDYLQKNLVSVNTEPDEETIKYIRQRYGK